MSTQENVKYAAQIDTDDENKSNIPVKTIVRYLGIEATKDMLIR